MLDHFNADPAEYCAIFTPNASGALRLVGESYPFRPGGCFVLLTDNHNSVNGIREFARRAGAQLRLIPCTRSELRATTDQVAAALSEHGAAPRLFAYPAQSNFSGVQHPLDWIELAHNHGWQVVLDAAAYVPTNPLDLSTHRPDFVAVSCYKLFGWPTGIGALLARGDALAVLRRPWFAGGTVKMASTSVHVQAPGHEGFEDGTVNYAAMPGVVIGLDYLRKVGIETIHTRTRCLTGWLLCRLGAMRHTNGQPLAQIYGPTTTECRGPTVAFNFLTPDREVVDERIIERAATARGISLRTGCFCNPGCGETAFALDPAAVAAAADLDPGTDIDDYLDVLGMPSLGAVRVSFGLASNLADVEAFLRLANDFRDAHHPTDGLPARHHC